MERLREGEHFFREALVSQVSRSAPGAGDSAPAPSGSACSKNLEYIGGEILSLDENTVTPLEALTRIHGWKALLEGVCAELAEKPPESRKKPRREQSEPELF
jgi:hypothetical protein